MAENSGLEPQALRLPPVSNRVRTLCGLFTMWQRVEVSIPLGSPLAWRFSRPRAEPSAYSLCWYRFLVSIQALRVFKPVLSPD